MSSKDEGFTKNTDVMKELNDAFSGSGAPKLTKAEIIMRKAREIKVA
jgi:hypothetical protein